MDWFSKLQDAPEADKRPRFDDGDIKADHGKTRWDLLPIRALEGIAQILTYGARKYDDNNWLKSNHPDRYYAAAMRHIAEVRKGNWIDPESGLPHIDHANCCMVMYRELLIKQRKK
jgi:hypothetical protein